MAFVDQKRRLSTNQGSCHNRPSVKNSGRGSYLNHLCVKTSNLGSCPNRPYVMSNADSILRKLLALMISAGILAKLLFSILRPVLIRHRLP
jgi:hypothetical protein